MALEQLVNGMTGQQLANTIKNNFDKVLDVESAENKAENAGKALKTDYDATRYVEMELADGTPIRMRWDVFCQAIASVVAEHINVIRRTKYLSSNEKLVISSASLGLIIVSSSSSGNSAIYLGSSFGVVKVFETSESFCSQIEVSKIDNGGIEVTNIHSVARYVEVVIIANNGR